MRELSYSGFSVLHEETLEPVYRMKFLYVLKTQQSVCSRNYNCAEKETGQRPCYRIASGTGFCCIYISKYMMNREIGFGRKCLVFWKMKGCPMSIFLQD